MTSILFSVIPILIVALIFYLIIRRTHESRSGVRHAYYYFVSFITIGILYIAFSDLVRLVWTAGNGSYYDYYNNSEHLLKSIAGRLSAIVIALPVWAFHWMKATPTEESDMDILSRKTYSLGLVICTIIIMLISWSFLFYYLITWALGVPETDIAQNLPAMFSYSLPATILWIVHFNMWRKLNDRQDNPGLDSVKPLV